MYCAFKISVCFGFISDHTDKFQDKYDDLKIQPDTDDVNVFINNSNDK